MLNNQTKKSKSMFLKIFAFDNLEVPNKIQDLFFFILIIELTINLGRQQGLRQKKRKVNVGQSDMNFNMLVQSCSRVPLVQDGVYSYLVVGGLLFLRFNYLKYPIATRHEVWILVYCIVFSC